MTGHACPGGCGTQVARNRFACRADWYRLPADLRAAIWAGYRARPLGDQHRAAMADAIDWYRANTQGDQPGPSRGGQPGQQAPETPC